MQIDATIEDLELEDYSTDRFEELERRGFRLIVKHAKSLYSFA